ncbi:PilZ domain-containing protein [Vibrio crassostreae]|uniref:PilZ domain-containing protein n=1 Tax=Vibrio crassostreae TaxID=246167 RepID=UPI000F485A25|nr:PilZ domain-containing protein [Vibrio crassostreae]ROP24937.1 PilZ domain-containing protein [Vibrio crassostreae]ROP25717.1 PilZ domain-containing protein [Vibrio crassostreae]RPF00286.1 PilZ domain-containing protein [Vibrio crassostreae]TCN65611.1 PilZ domain-containing protein [Vibrio crassostreae]TCV08460.1 PilZ domain-containing protein [Vibrio crassostreae]
MQQSEILSVAERLIPAYHAEDFEFLLSQMTEGESPSLKLLVKMELNRIMAPCTKSIDLRGRIDNECRQFTLDGRKHWLDDIALNAYQRGTKKFKGYTEGAWELVMTPRTQPMSVVKTSSQGNHDITSANSPYEAEAINLGYDLKRQENRLKISSQVEITTSKGQSLHGVTVDISPSGAKFKVPSAFRYNLGEIISVKFSELIEKSQENDVNQAVEFRVLGIDESYENNAVKFLRTIKVSDNNVVARLLDESLNSISKKTSHENQDRIIRTRTRGIEHTYLKHTCNLPLFFSGSELKLALLTDNNHPLWQYWHDERNQQALGTLFNEQRMNLLAKPGVKGTSNVIYSFTHEHQNKTLFYSMMLPEASREQRQLFWHIGGKRKSWKAFKFSVFELSDTEQQALAKHSDTLAQSSVQLTHCGILQEISDHESAADYLLSEKPRIPSSELNRFRHPRTVVGNIQSIYFDSQTRRKEPRYQFKSPLQLTSQDGAAASGHTLDISKRGLSINLEHPMVLKINDPVLVNFNELQLYDKNLPLSTVPYHVIRVSPNGRNVQLVIAENAKTMRTIAFLNGLIDQNQSKLIKKKEILPTNSLLESLHNILLSKMVSNPIFIDKPSSTLRCKIIGVNFPLNKHLTLLAKLGHNQKFSLEPIFKGHTSSLLAEPLKRIEGAEPKHHDVYIAAVKFGDKIQSVHTKLVKDFASAKERILFIKKAQHLGDVYVLRVTTAPIFNPLTSLFQSDLEELSRISMHQAKKLENEITAFIGYGEIEDITDEVLIRLELTR